MRMNDWSSHTLAVCPKYDTASKSLEQLEKMRRCTQLTLSIITILMAELILLSLIYNH